MANKGQFQKGHPKAGGRRRGTPNKATRDVKEFLAELVRDPEVQAAVRERVLGGDMTAFFKALEMVNGKPRQTLDLNQTNLRMIDYPSRVATDKDVAR